MRSSSVVFFYLKLGLVATSLLYGCSLTVHCERLMIRLRVGGLGLHHRSFAVLLYFFLIGMGFELALLRFGVRGSNLQHIRRRDNFRLVRLRGEVAATLTRLLVGRRQAFPALFKRTRLSFHAVLAAGRLVLLLLYDSFAAALFDQTFGVARGERICGAMNVFECRLDAWPMAARTTMFF